uniref:preprotein translocase subunit SecG n=1 Tax=Thaumasiovibrio occultus TaxID=1891184 RepID=UPI000B35D305|nr:preprotein translocase subunit SecG [Thaumasiovibrio occultus]
MLYEILLVIYLLAALGVIGLVMMQQGKGADMGASFGAGASNTVFGASGSGNFMTRATTFLATIFFVISLILGNMTTHSQEEESGWSGLTQAQEEVAAPQASVDAQESAVPAESVEETETQQ